MGYTVEYNTECKCILTSFTGEQTMDVMEDWLREISEKAAIQGLATNQSNERIALTCRCCAWYSLHHLFLEVLGKLSGVPQRQVACYAESADRFDHPALTHKLANCVVRGVIGG